MSKSIYGRYRLALLDIILYHRLMIVISILSVDCKCLLPGAKGRNSGLKNDHAAIYET